MYVECLLQYLLLNTLMFHWQYLNPASLKDPAIIDVEDFKHLKLSTNPVGLNMEEKYNSLQIVAAVFHLGNITFEVNTADCKGSSYIWKFC